MISPQLITMLGSGVLGAVLKLWTQHQADKAENQKLLIEGLQAKHDIVHQVREFNTPQANYMRKFLVFCILGMAVFILVYPPIFGEHTVIPVETTKGFKFLFFDFTKQATEWVQLTGVVNPPWLSECIMAIFGFYLGSNGVKR